MLNPDQSIQELAHCADGSLIAQHNFAQGTGNCKSRTLAALKILLFMSGEKCVRFPPCSRRVWYASEMRKSHVRCVRLGRTAVVIFKTPQLW